MKTPYDEMRPLPAWGVVERALGELVANGDVEEKTDRVYVVGYLMAALGREPGALADLMRWGEMRGKG